MDYIYVSSASYKIKLELIGRMDVYLLSKYKVMNKKNV
jgi:hypothetical protein